MSWDSKHGCVTPGSTGRAAHLGDPLTVEQIRNLPDGAEIVVTWDGGNGPHPYRVLVDFEGVRRTEGLYCDPILPSVAYANPLNRVTVGWDDAAREWVESRIPEPEHIQAKMRQLRTGKAGRS